MKTFTFYGFARNKDNQIQQYNSIRESLAGGGSKSIGNEWAPVIYASARAAEKDIAALNDKEWARIQAERVAA